MNMSSHTFSTESQSIIVYGAREHNLNNVNVSIPRSSLTVITGLSGSGKSTLAFDTIYAEGQRRYVESLSAYARQFLDMMKKPDVDRIEGLSPAISIEQKTTSRNPRSTVGTVTEIYDYMRLLFARIGVPYSPETGLPITSQSISEMVDRLLSFPISTRLYIMAPIVRNRKGEYQKELHNLLKRGFQRVKIDGEFYTLDNTPKLDKKYKHTIEVVVDRVVISEDESQRLADSLEIALDLADGLAIAEFVDRKDADGQTETLLFSSRFACPVSGFTIEEIEPRLFSFNNPKGACPTCSGLGTKKEIAAELVIPDTSISLFNGAIMPWSRSKTPSPYYLQTLEALATHYDFSMHTAFNELPTKIQNIILNGSDGEKIAFQYDDGNARVFRTHKVFEGVINNLNRRFMETDSPMIRDQLQTFMSLSECTKCHGKRLCASALAVKIAQHDITQIANLSILDAQKWFDELKTKLDTKYNTVATPILKEIEDRLNFLLNVGLGYLTLSRESGTLSGGESQRIRLASQIGSGLTGVLYVLDEPSIGLHQSDNNRLLQTLFKLRDLGNTLIVVEHDEDAIRNADYIIDMGPEAGTNGGNVVASGTLNTIIETPQSITGDYLAGRKFIAVPQQRRDAKNNQWITIKKASHNNLQDIDVSFPLGCLITVTGVSGSGKSSLIIETLYKHIAHKLNRSKVVAGKCENIEGLENIDKIIDIDQSPIGRTPRSNPATYIGVFSFIRDWFVNLPESRARGYKAGRFSFNVKGGRCENCQGDGVIKIEMHFLADVYISCDVCNGARYNRETLEIKYRDKSIADILDMTVAEGMEFFKVVPSIFSRLEMMHKVGLDYIKIGQRATTLSGGEAQRVKLSKELSKRGTGRTMYILDEPTTGLHFHDVARLIDVLQKLVSQGNTVIVIEHNLDVIKAADYIIDIGPNGGDGGGELVCSGTPEHIITCQKSLTAQYLKPMLSTSNVKEKT